MAVFVFPFLLMALFYCQEIMSSMLFKGMSKRAHGKNVNAISFNGVALPTKHRFYLCHLKQNKSETRSRTRTGMFTEKHKNIFTIFKSYSN